MLKFTDLLTDHRGDVRKRPLKSQIAEKLISMISTGMISSEEFLPSERDLSKTYAVSRETIRGALQILSEQGIIKIMRGSRTQVIKGAAERIESGTFLNELQDFDALTVAEARTVVEVAIVRSAAINITQESLDKLAAMLGVQEHILQDPVAFQISDKEFHILIYNSGRNDLLANIAENVYSYALELRTVALKEELSTVRSFREHQQIFRALSNHDPDAAERAISDHVDSIFKSTLMMNKNNNDSE
jgi:GntR family transcriptional regulator, sialic acid-inducible nan operon repressor